MPLPVIIGCSRIAINWASDTSPVTATNVIHVSSTETDYEDLFTAVGLALVGNPNMWLALDDSFQPVTMDLTPLDGETATITHGPINVTGASDGGVVPQVAQVTSFKTAKRGRRATGRVFAGPVAESGMANGSFIGSVATNPGPAWLAFQEDLQAHTPAINHVVASYAEPEVNIITSYVTHSRVATQRRRAGRNYQ